MALDRSEYNQIRAQLSFERSYWVTLSVIVLDWGLLAAAVHLVRGHGFAAFLFSQALLALVFFHNFALVHECGHGTASSSRWLNTLTGHYASVLCVLPFFPWKSIHQKHHVWVGITKQDPATANLKNWQEEGRIPWLLRFAWRSWLPLSALAQHVVFWSYPVTMFKHEKHKFLQCVASVLLLPASYLTLYWLAPAVFRPRNFALAFVIYLFAEELVNMPHHAGLYGFAERLPLWEQWRAARSCYYPRGVSELFVLNFNFHVEHHLYPSLPWYRLRGARNLIRPALGAEYNEAVGIGWNLSNRSRDIQQLLLPRRDAEHRPL